MLRSPRDLAYSSYSAQVAGIVATEPSGNACLMGATEIIRVYYSLQFYPSPRFCKVILCSILPISVNLRQQLRERAALGVLNCIDYIGRRIYG